MNSIFGFVRDVIFLLIGFCTMCFVWGLCLNHPIFIALLLAGETLIFIPAEINSRKNHKAYYEKGGKC